MFMCNYSPCFILNVISQHVLFLLIYIFLRVKCFKFLQGSHDLRNTLEGLARSFVVMVVFGKLHGKHSTVAMELLFSLLTIFL